MKSEFQLIGKYLVLLLKNWLIYLFLLLDILGIIVRYKTDIHIPNWVLYSFPSLAILFAGYRIFKNNSPKITIGKPQDEEYDIKFNLTYTYNSFNIKFETYITNFGLQSGALEDIKLKFLGVNEIRDEFILKNMDISCGNFKLCKERTGFSIMDLNPKEYSFKFPMILKPGTIIPIYLLIPMSISADFGSKDELMEWIEKIHLELEYKIRDGLRSEIIKVPFTFNVNNLLELKEKEIESRELFDKAFSDK